MGGSFLFGLLRPLSMNIGDDAAGRWLGLDVGGANLKIADGRGRAASVAFPLWKQPDRLSAAIVSLLDRFEAPACGIALTMTGELCDCFATKADGVRSIVEATVAATELPVRVATVDDRWLAPAEAIAAPQLVAAANWRLAARWAASRIESPALWIDCGSTTVDLVPLEPGRVCATGKNDTERLLAGELVYTGVRRTPVCAIAPTLPYRGESCPVMAEWFATSADVWVTLGELPEDPGCSDTADGRPLTHEAARDRLARCIGADRTTFSSEDAHAVADAIASRQAEAILNALLRQGHEVSRAVISGEGEFLARRALERRGRAVGIDSVGSWTRAEASRAFPATAAAALASRELGPAE